MSQVTLKLIGAQRYSCRTHGVDLVEAGDTVSVSSEAAEHLLSLTYKAGPGHYKPVFSKNLKAPVELGGMPPVALGERKDEQARAEKAEQELLAAEQAREAAEKRANDLEQRILRLEESTKGGDSGSADTDTDGPAKPATRKRAKSTAKN